MRVAKIGHFWKCAFLGTFEGSIIDLWPYIYINPLLCHAVWRWQLVILYRDFKNLNHINIGVGTMWHTGSKVCFKSTKSESLGTGSNYQPLDIRTVALPIKLLSDTQNTFTWVINLCAHIMTSLIIITAQCKYWLEDSGFLLFFL